MNEGGHPAIRYDLHTLGIQVGMRVTLVLLFLAATSFISAGTLKYWEAWVYLAVIVIAMISTVAYFFKRDPELLERRMRLKEKEPAQQLLVKLGGPIFFLAYLIPGVDDRVGWSDVSVAIVLVADAVVFAAYGLFVLVLRENRFASRVIEVEVGQHVVTTGPYAFVRHPMYLAALFIYLCTPVALGSYYGLIPAVLLPVVLVVRIRNEEEVLIRDLEGYSDYIKKVQYRLIPGVW